jgi:lipid-A-disaccharide synthase
LNAGDAASPLIFLVAGEASGDVLGGRLMRAMSELTGGHVRFDGIGGPLMAEAGLDSRFPIAELALMGITEVLPHVPRLLRRLRELDAAIRAARPAAIVTIDAPSFGLRLQRRLAGAGIPRIHYVAPQVWAWRPGRAKKLARSIDHLLALLPFEPPFFARYGLDCRFVGHPVVESGAGQGDGAAFRAAHGLGAAPVLLVLPGSRRGEVAHHAEIFGEAVGLLLPRFPGLRIVVPTVPHVARLVREHVARWPAPAIVLDDAREKYAAFAAADAALAASGTVALELALSDTPMVIAYRAHPLTAAIVQRLVLTRYASLVNILTDRQIVPELIQKECRPSRLAGEVAALLEGPAADAQRAGFEDLRRILQSAGESPSRRAARAVLDIAQLISR